MTKTRVGIFGYGNLGRGVELACRQNDDMELVALFTRRDPATVKPLTEGVPVFAADEMASHRDNIDVLVLCGGSANDLPEQTPACANLFNVVDSFDTHANIPAHFAKVDAAAQESGNVAVISAGWDPGMFSIARLYASSVLPEGEDYTFWGRGVSQGHSDAIRRIEGVADARQYTVPVASALEAVRNGEKPQLTTRQKHTRECFVVAEAGADLAIVDVDLAEAQKTAMELAQSSGRRVIAVQTDVTDPVQVQEMVDTVTGELGGREAAFCNAGICLNVPAEEMSYEQWRKVLDVNLTGVFLTAQAAGKYMLAHGGGSIINTASMSAHIVNVPQPQCAYNASKAGVIQLTKSLAIEWAKRGVRVNSISPGYMATELTMNSPSLQPLIAQWNEMAPMGRMGQPRELQSICVYLAGDTSSFTTGADFVVDGAFTCF